VQCRYSEVDDPYLEYAPKQFYIKMVFINSSSGQRPSVSYADSRDFQDNLRSISGLALNQKATAFIA